MGIFSSLQRVQHWGERRPSIPGEHWFALGLGLWMSSCARRSRSLVGRLAGNAVDGELMARFASRKDGVIGKLAGAARRGADKLAVTDTLLRKRYGFNSY